MRQQNTRTHSIVPMGELQDGRWPSVLRTLAITPRAPHALQLDERLLHKHEQTMRLTVEHQLPIRFIGYAPLFEGTQLYQGADSDWAMMNLTEDPHYASIKKLYLPPQAKRDIERIDEAGLDDFVIFIAHELPQGAVAAGQRIPPELLMPPPPPKLDKRLQRLQVSLRYFWRVVTAALKGMTVVGAASVAAVAAAPVVAVGAVGALANLDPILFGVHIDPSRTINGQPVGMWYYLTHWYWPEE